MQAIQLYSVVYLLLCNVAKHVVCVTFIESHCGIGYIYFFLFPNRTASFSEIKVHILLNYNKQRFVCLAAKLLDLHGTFSRPTINKYKVQQLLCELLIHLLI